MPLSNSCSMWKALSVLWCIRGVPVVMVLLRLATVRAKSCYLSVALQHSAVWVLFSPSARLGFSPCRERVSGMAA